jgi:hypothetical protein
VAFHGAFAASILFGVLGILFALRIHDADAAATVHPQPSVMTTNERAALLTGHHGRQTSAQFEAALPLSLGPRT